MNLLPSHEDVSRYMYVKILEEVVSSYIRFHGVMVSTQDSESCDPSSNLGGTCIFLSISFVLFL